MKKHLLLALCLAASAAASAQNATPPAAAITITAPASKASSAQAKLVGQWEHSFQTAEWHLQQTTELKDNKKFTQHAIYKAPDGTVLADNIATGDWSFDGVVFIRLFTTLNNEKLKPSRQIRMEQKIVALTDSSFHFIDKDTQKKLVFNRLK
jgi:phosphate-selective porin